MDYSVRTEANVREEPRPHSLAWVPCRLRNWEVELSGGVSLGRHQWWTCTLRSSDSRWKFRKDCVREKLLSPMMEGISQTYASAVTWLAHGQTLCIRVAFSNPCCPVIVIYQGGIPHGGHDHNCYVGLQGTDHRGSSEGTFWGNPTPKLQVTSGVWLCSIRRIFLAVKSMWPALPAPQITKVMCYFPIDSLNSQVVRVFEVLVEQSFLFLQWSFWLKGDLRVAFWR